MSRVYSDPERENDTYALPDVEVFYHDGRWDDGDCFSPGVWSDDEPAPAGWYYWYCFPGCLPDSDPIGPYETEQAAFDAMRKDNQS